MSVTMIVGYPAAGKSSLSKRFNDYTYLNRDTEGGKLKSLVPKMEAALAKGEKIVLDNTNLTKELRKPFLDSCQTLGVKVKCVWLQTSIEDAQMNACLRMIRKHGKILSDEEIKRAKCPNTFPAVVLFAARNKFEKPEIKEGFSEIEKVKFVRTWGAEYKNKALILDYDGTLRDTLSGEKYPRSPEDIKGLEGRQARLQEYVDKGYLLLGASNQSGVGKGLLTEEDAISCFEKTNELVGHKIDYMFCPHRVGPGKNCYCRKPQVGMGATLIERYKLNPSECIMVGDMTSDKTFATRCGFQFAWAKDFF